MDSRPGRIFQRSRRKTVKFAFFLRLESNGKIKGLLDMASSPINQRGGITLEFSGTEIQSETVSPEPADSPPGDNFRSTPAIYKS